MRLIFDMESNGLLDEVTQMWCIVAKDIDKGIIHRFGPNDIFQALEYLLQAETLIGHNIIGYDIPVFKKFHPFEYTGELIDTLVVSRLQYPDRPSPKGYKGKAPHSIEAYGYRLGRGKPEHNDWSCFTPEMLHRCSEDVEITHMIYDYLLEEREK